MASLYNYYGEHFVHNFESHRRETWRHTGRRIEPPIPLETPSPLPPPPSPLIYDEFHVPDELIVLLYMWGVLIQTKAILWIIDERFPKLNPATL